MVLERLKLMMANNEKKIIRKKTSGRGKKMEKEINERDEPGNQFQDCPSAVTPVSENYFASGRRVDGLEGDRNVSKRKTNRTGEEEGEGDNTFGQSVCGLHFTAIQKVIVQSVPQSHIYLRFITLLRDFSIMRAKQSHLPHLLKFSLIHSHIFKIASSFRFY